MKRFALTTAIALAIASPVLASDQLAASAGVEPGVYTTNELITLIAAKEKGDWTVVNAILDGNLTDNSGDDRTSAGHVQLAESLGVNPAAYATNELVELRRATEEQDQSRVNYLKDNGADSNAGSATFSTRNSSFSAGHLQLAEALDVNPADFSTNELIQLKRAKEDGDQAEVRYILQNAG
ncbi:hypothetical protein [Tropicimonas aquimaris]|uniref:Ankyrin repeats (3 copies) n=1 Tax=Tropicimonas aquimaris TaxID=914152 RepID=A0ABW3INX0_9RHOB